MIRHFMKRVGLLGFCLVAFPIMASHIVGGEFEILHISGNRYRINLIYYFDVLNNEFGGVPPEVSEPFITAAIFRKSDNRLMDYVQLNFVSRTPVNYTQPECSEGYIVTQKLIYTRDVTLSPDVYKDPGGYYITWERCCRNYTITNIVSKQPPENAPNFPDAAGQAFYLEFPPVVKDGELFINSSPRLFPPLNDFACPYRPYYADFSGIDDDGDSLVYSLVTPLSTHQTLAVPPLLPAPFPEVKWSEGYSLDNIMNGDPDLSISSDGLLRVTPTTLGLFVFAVKCEEYRDGVKIGEVRRDFQMLVVDGCEPADPPNIMGKELAAADYTFDENMTVTFSNTVTDEERCVQVRISDPDASNPAHSFTEEVKIKAIPINFKGSISDILPDVRSGTLTDGSTIEFDICFDECPPIEGPFQVAIVAMDDECALPLTDTLKITVNIEPPPNARPQFLTADVIEQIQEGQLKTWPIEGIDADGDTLEAHILTDGFDPANFGISINEIELVPGHYEAELVWDPRCDVYDFNSQTEFELKILLEDKDKCGFSKADTMVLNLAVQLPDNSKPEIEVSLTPDEVANGVTRKVFEPLVFTVTGTDADGDDLVLVAIGSDFDLEDYEMKFPGDTAKGVVSSLFEWTVPCGKGTALRDAYQLHFVVIDSANYCHIIQTDLVTINVNVEPPDNSPPNLTVVNTNPELEFENNEQSLLVGQQISLGISAIDGNLDDVAIDLVEASGTVEPVGYVFEPVEGVGSASTTFAWYPDCSIFQNGIYANEYTFRFVASDDRCHNAKGDTVAVKFYISDVPSGPFDFLPPNRMTPNNDGVNEYFAMVRETPKKELVSILPPDNCQGTFVNISIYNRWGQEVFTSTDRDFRWYPDEKATGIYFYTLRYSNREYKGSIALRSDQ